MGTASTIIHFIIYFALLMVCMKRRSMGDFPLIAVIGSWLLFLSSALTLADRVIGNDRLNRLLRHLVPDEWVASDSGLFLINLSTLLGFTVVLGMFLFALGIFMLARQRSRQAMESERFSPPAP